MLPMLNLTTAIEIASTIEWRHCQDIAPTKTEAEVREQQEEVEGGRILATAKITSRL